MKTSKKNIHRGAILKNAVQKSDLNISQIAKRAGFSRASYYNHIDEANLPYSVLERYGRAIHYDFMNDLPDMMKYIMEEAQQEIAKPANIDEAVRQRDMWRAKYYQLMEQYQQLINEHFLLVPKRNDEQDETEGY